MFVVDCTGPGSCRGVLGCLSLQSVLPGLWYEVLGRAFSVRSTPMEEKTYMAGPAIVG